MMAETLSSVSCDGIALPVVADLPAGCAAFVATDANCEPIVRKGERVAVDLTDREPVEGALYLRRFRTAGPHARRLAVVEALRMRTRSNPDGVWMLGPHRKHVTGGEAASDGTRRWCDGPFPLDAVHDVIVGRVVAVIDENAPCASEARTDANALAGHSAPEVVRTGVLRASYFDDCADYQVIVL